MKKDENSTEQFKTFRAAYIAALIAARAADHRGFNHAIPVEVTVDKMIAAVRKPARNDWLKYNPSMKQAAKSIGITTSPRLREFIQALPPECFEKEAQPC